MAEVCPGGGCDVGAGDRRPGRLSLAYVTPATGWIVEGGLALLRTTDTGRSWHRVTINA